MTETVLDLVAIANELESFLLMTVPKVDTVQKYGGTLFTRKPDQKEGQFCGIFIYKSHVQVSFSKGAELTDPEKLLKGNGKYRRHINYSLASQIDYEQLERLVMQACELWKMIFDSQIDKTNDVSDGIMMTPFSVYKTRLTNKEAVVNQNHK